jgi:hypothetical protein
MSLYGVMYFRRTGTLPGASRIPQNANMIDPDAEAFSTAPNDDEYAPVGMHDHDPKDDHNDFDTSHVDRYDTAYNSAGSTYGSTVGGGGAASHIGNAGSNYAPNYGSEPDYRRVSSPLGMNPSSSYGGGNERAHFPTGNYD